ncbi:MAG TPA: alkaline phosphatase family protein [Terriglobales bacterium]|nr:alkaline phosphatase family protein [Terriglobales bacterium]
MLFALTLGGVGCGGGSRHTRPPNLPVVGHVFVLVDENHSYTDVIGNPAMPYTNSLAQKYSLATNYYANAHPSLPNYFMLTTGQLVTSTDDYNGTVASDNAANAVTTAGKTWKIYAESLPNIGYLGPTIVPYDKSHDPFAFFSDVLTSNSQAANIVPFTQLANDIQNNALPNYAMIVPNMMDDGHDCPNEAAQCTDAQKLAHADSWLKTNIDPLISSSAFANGVLIYTWDESEISDNANGGGRVATLLLGAHVRQGYQSTMVYQHQSTLRISMELLNISDLPGTAASAPDMAEFFTAN